MTKANLYFVWCAQALIHILDLIVSVIIALVLSFGFARPAYAYVDPSVLTYTIQALAGVAVAISAVAGVVWRRVRRRIIKKLGIDENAHKVIEYRVTRTEEHYMHKQADAVAQRKMANIPSPREKKNKKALKMSWAKRLGVAGVVAFVFSFTFCFVAPCELVAGSVSSLIFGVESVAPIMAGVSFVVCVMLGFFLSLFRGKAFWILSFLLLAFSLCAWLQAMFLNEGLPIADGTPLILSDMMLQLVVSLAVWIAIIALSVFLVIKQPLLIMRTALFVAVALVVVQGAGLASLALDYSPYVKSTDGESVLVTDKGLYDVSSKHNVIVFVLDSFDVSILVEVAGSDSSVAQDFSDFVSYDNSVGSLIPTRYAIPNMLTGDVPQNTELFSAYLSRESTNTEFVDSLINRGIDVGIYSDSVGSLANALSEKVTNIHPQRFLDSINVGGMVRVLLQCSLYRDMTWVMKPAFYFTTDDLNNCVAKTPDPSSQEENIYVMNDVGFKANLTTYGLSVDSGELSSKEGCYRFIHLQGSHGPYVLNEWGDISSEGETDDETQTRGVLRIVTEYINQLKTLGVYDNTDIIITSDHGIWAGDSQDIYEPTCPAMLVKTVNTEIAEIIKTGSTAEDSSSQVYANYYKTANTGLLTNHTPISRQDFQGSVQRLFGFIDEHYPVSMFDINLNDQRTRYYYATSMIGAEDTAIVEWEINGNALNWNSWSKTGQVWDLTTDENFVQ